MTTERPMSVGAQDAPADIALPRPPGGFRSWLERHPRIVDWAIAIVCEFPLLAAAVIMRATSQADVTDIVAMGCAAVIGFVVLLFRRRFPLAGTLVLAVIATIPAVVPVNGLFGGWLDLYVMLYTVGAHATTPRTWIGYGAAAAAGIANGVALQLTGNPLGAAGIGLPTAVFYLVPTLIGISVGSRRRYVAAVVQRAQDLARERDQRAQLAVTEERSRVAREMHDIVSHGLTVMVMLSEGAAARAEAGAPDAPEAMRRVATAGRDALADMRRLLGLLRDPNAPAELAPAPGAADIDELIAGFREAGLPVRWTRAGPPLAAETAGHVNIPLSAYRILQEGLTNTMRHASGARSIDVRLENGEDAVVIVIENSAADAPASAPLHGSGRGLIGIRERAALHDGTVEAGPTPSGGWRLRAELRKETT
ncbi:MAG: sensor histidine kinase [Microbacterium sp.]